MPPCAARGPSAAVKAAYATATQRASNGTVSATAAGSRWRSSVSPRMIAAATPTLPRKVGSTRRSPSGASGSAAERPPGQRGATTSSSRIGGSRRKSKRRPPAAFAQARVKPSAKAGSPTAARRRAMLRCGTA